jgi:hypothetical protein
LFDTTSCFYGYLVWCVQVVHAEANALLNKNQAHVTGAVSRLGLDHSTKLDALPAASTFVLLAMEGCCADCQM